MYGREFPNYDDICHGHKYTKREKIGGKWRYWYDTAITGKAYTKKADEAADRYQKYNSQYKIDKLFRDTELGSQTELFRKYLKEDSKSMNEALKNRRRAEADYTSHMYDYYNKSLAGKTEKAVNNLINTWKMFKSRQQNKKVKTKSYVKR